jgi:hypothetical protein
MRKWREQACFRKTIISLTIFEVKILRGMLLTG